MAVDRRVLAIARRQHGVVATAQLRAAGMTRGELRHRVRSGWLTPRHRGVYLVGPLESPLSASMAAVLACGAGAVLSHRPAAVLWGLLPPPAGQMHVTTARDVRRPGIRVHRATLHPEDARRRDGIPVTSPERTLLDLAAATDARELERAANEARILRLVTDLSLDEQLARYPTHRGLTALRGAPEPQLTRSEAEHRLLTLIRAARLPAPQTNTRVAGLEVDFLWPEHRLVVEVDGFTFHSPRAAFERDRRRDQELTARGYRVIRVTWRQLTEEPEAVIATLAAALAQPAPSLLARSSTVSA